MSTFSSTIDANDLRNQFRGVLVEPGDSRWDASRQAYNLTLEQEPLLIAFPVDSADVQVLVSYAAERGIEVAPQRTGHNAEPLGSLGDVILVKTDAMRGVEIDEQRQVARVLSGTKWADVVPVASDLGLAAMHGSTPDVSVVGYSLGGGIGWYARKHGMSALERARDRARDGRRPVPARRRRPRRGAVLGAARRRRQLRHRHRDRDPAVSDLRGVRRRAVLPVGARERGAERVERVDEDGAGRGDVGRPHPPGAADRGGAAVPARPELRDPRGGRDRRRGVRCGAACARCASSARRSTRSR